ncbi:putative 4-aminobutyrate aminotransferase [Meira miltonrushii]|uniref:Putative 4-aminobutyrate aminotransferase n=1 Tax=Meira miltonrushii TaxID=1280837 RepID=A0A316VJZ3_9BASI|nr:putative 4-aminobutyrate aminotransferase [Meira miltonrushii]PWN37929.1 putative 4-aminobutyrate aminotransferase [Meira miltonrushii]
MSQTLSAEFGTAHVAHGVGRLTPMIMSKAKGVHVWDEKDNKYLDMTCGIGVTNLGHCHEGVTKAAQEQCATMVHAQVNIGFSAAYLRLLEKFLPHLANVHPSLDSVFLWNSGAEAVEASVKLARAATKKQNIIVMQGSYHGRTMGTMAMTKSKTIYGLGFGPLMPGVFSTPFPYYSQFGLPESTPQSELISSSLHQLELVLAQQTAPTDTAAIILEPVLGEGGYVPAPDAFLHGLRKICDKYDILLIADEVQCGMGRTGKMFYSEYSGVRPDIIVFAKGIANGFPLSGIASRKELMDLQKPGTMGGTYGGNAVACAAARAVLTAFEEEKILDNVAGRSKQVFDFLDKFQKTPAGSVIQEVRGRGGLMVGIQFANPKMQEAQQAHSTAGLNASSHNTTAAEAWQYHPSDAGEQLAPKVVQACIKRKMLILSTSCFDVIRMIPPLNVTEQEMQQGLEIFAEAVTEVAAAAGVKGA